MAKPVAKPKAIPRPAQAPKRRHEPARKSPWLFLVAAAGLAALGVVAFIALGGGSEERTSASGALPNTPDYHSLLVSPSNPDQLTLGTHEGLFSSADGGLSWKNSNLAGQDAMNLAQTEGETIWAAGHSLLARSSDGGLSWQDMQPAGLPSLDVHGFAVDAKDSKTLFAAIAGQGIYRSTDNGASFELVTAEFGRGVMALASLPDGRLLAGDMERQGLLASSDRGKTWKGVVQGQIMGIAVNPKHPERILASGTGVLLSTDGGRNWTQALSLPDGSGPVAWSSSSPQVAYVVGFNRSLYRTRDGGTSWTPVVGREAG